MSSEFTPPDYRVELQDRFDQMRAEVLAKIPVLLDAEDDDAEEDGDEPIKVIFASNGSLGAQNLQGTAAAQQSDAAGSPSPASSALELDREFNRVMAEASVFVEDALLAGGKNTPAFAAKSSVDAVANVDIEVSGASRSFEGFLPMLTPRLTRVDSAEIDELYESVSKRE